MLAAVNWTANSTPNGFDDWRMPSLSEAQDAAAKYRIGAVPGLLEPGQTGTNCCRFYWTSAAKGSASAYAVHLADPTGSTVVLTQTSWGSLAMVRDAGKTVDDGAAGYADNGGWTVVSGGYEGDYRQQVKGNGSKYATWTFDGLEIDATYKIDATWKAGSKLATNAPFTVLDGAALEGTKVLNQRLAPDDYQVNSTFWKGLGVFTVDSGTLQVKLTNNANGSVAADAVRLFRVYPSITPPDAPSAPAPTVAATNDAALLMFLLEDPTSPTGRRRT